MKCNILLVPSVNLRKSNNKVVTSLNAFNSPMFVNSKAMIQSMVVDIGEYAPYKFKVSNSGVLNRMLGMDEEDDTIIENSESLEDFVRKIVEKDHDDLLKSIVSETNNLIVKFKEVNKDYFKKLNENDIKKIEPIVEIQIISIQDSNN